MPLNLQKPEQVCIRFEKAEYDYKLQTLLSLYKVCNLYRVCNLYKISKTQPILKYVKEKPQKENKQPTSYPTNLVNCHMPNWIDWHRLEQTIPLDNLPAFHREFLKLTKPDEADWDTAFLRQVQGKVQGSLKALERQGLAKTEDEKVFVSKEKIPEAFWPYITD